MIFIFIIIFCHCQEQFGEQPDQDSQGLFGWVSAFICEFRKAQVGVARNLAVQFAAW